MRLSPLGSPLLSLLFLVGCGSAGAQSLTAGSDGWHLERLSDEFTALRTDVVVTDAADPQPRRGLLILTCEPHMLRIRFQIGQDPRQPASRTAAEGRAMVRAPAPEGFVGPSRAPSYLSARFFSDGSLELYETAPFNNSGTRGFVQLLQVMAPEIELLLFRTTEPRVFARGTALQVRLTGLSESLGSIYGFEGLCFRRQT